MATSLIKCVSKAVITNCVTLMEIMRENFETRAQNTRKMNGSQCKIFLYGK